MCKVGESWEQSRVINNAEWFCSHRWLMIKIPPSMEEDQSWQSQKEKWSEEIWACWGWFTRRNGGRRRSLRLWKWGLMNCGRQGARWGQNRILESEESNGVWQRKLMRLSADLLTSSSHQASLTHRINSAPRRARPQTHTHTQAAGMNMQWRAGKRGMDVQKKN